MKNKILLIKNFLNTLIFIFLCLSIFIALTSKVSLFGLKSYVVLSGSMSPALPTGSLVFVRPVSHYRLGDIIAFTNKAGLTITHRIIAIDSAVLKVAGDANDSPDSELISPTQVIGASVFYLPFIGFLAVSLHTPLWFGLFIVLPSLIFIAAELWHIKLEIETITEQKVLSRLHLDQS